jgi:hypothetical protein
VKGVKHGDLCRIDTGALLLAPIRSRAAFHNVEGAFRDAAGALDLD